MFPSFLWSPWFFSSATQQTGKAQKDQNTRCPSLSNLKNRGERVGIVVQPMLARFSTVSKGGKSHPFINESFAEKDLLTFSPGTSTQMQLSEPVEVSSGASRSSPWLATHTL